MILLEAGIAKCAIDVSDGLLQDLGHICKSSNVGAEIRQEDIPLSSPIRELALANEVDPYTWALRGGEDYSLLFTVEPGNEKKLEDVLEKEKIKAVSIGKVVPGAGIRVYSDGVEIQTGPDGGFDHFRSHPEE